MLLLGPVVQWRQTKKSGGTLWLLLDASRSMGLVDAQATPAEKLAWANAPGLLPKDSRYARPRPRPATLRCLRDELAALRASDSDSSDANADESTRVSELVDAAKVWEAQLNTVTGAT